MTLFLTSSFCLRETVGIDPAAGFLDELKKRLKSIKERGVVMRPGESLEDMFAVRSALYERYADITVEEKGASVEDTVNAAAQALRREAAFGLLEE